MELDKLIPINNINWIVKGKFVMFRKYEHIPVCFVEDDIIYVFLDTKIPKQIIKITQHLIKLGVNFYFTTPELSNPKGIIDFENEVVKHYLISYTQKEFFYGFREIEFDLIHNMVKWTEKENCFELVKNIYESVNKTVSRKHFDYYTNKEWFDYDKEIRDDFQSLYRDIQISKIL
jgi:hypothetical protein